MGGDSENESCRIRFGSETREEPTKRRVLQTVGRFITRCSLYLLLVSLNTPPLTTPVSLPHSHTPAGDKDGRVMGTRTAGKGDELVRKDGKPLERQRKSSRAEKEE